MHIPPKQIAIVACLLAIGCVASLSPRGHARRSDAASLPVLLRVDLVQSHHDLPQVPDDLVSSHSGSEIDEEDSYEVESLLGLSDLRLDFAILPLSSPLSRSRQDWMSAGSLPSASVLRC